MTDPLDVLWGGATTGRFDATDLAGLWTVREAERVQLALLGRWRRQGDALAGWKVAATSGRGRNAFGPGLRPFGFLLKKRVFPSGSRIELQRIRRAGLETELCFQLAQRVAGSEVTPTEARGAVASVSPAFEINEERVQGAEDDLGIRVADNLKQWGIVLGPEVGTMPQSNKLGKLVSTMRLDGKLLERVTAEGHIDDHFASIAALARELSMFDLALEPGDLVITGAFTRQDVSGPGRFDGSFKGLGAVSVTFV